MLLNQHRYRIMETQSFEKFSITLPAEMARIIREKVTSGGYGSASEVIREAMRGWLERQRRLAALDESNRARSRGCRRRASAKHRGGARSCVSGSARKSRAGGGCITAAAKLDLFQIGEDIRKEAPTRARTPSFRHSLTTAPRSPTCRGDIRSCPAMKITGSGDVCTGIT